MSWLEGLDWALGMEGLEEDEDVVDLGLEEDNGIAVWRRETCLPEDAGACKKKKQKYFKNTLNKKMDKNFPHEFLAFFYLIVPSSFLLATHNFVAIFLS